MLSNDPILVVKACRRFILETARLTGFTTLPTKRLFPEDLRPDVLVVNPSTNLLLVGDIIIHTSIGRTVERAAEYCSWMLGSLKSHLERGTLAGFALLLASDTPEIAEQWMAQLEMATMRLPLINSAGFPITYTLHYEAGIWCVAGSTDRGFAIPRQIPAHL